MCYTAELAEYVNQLHKEVTSILPDVEPLAWVFEIHPVVDWFENDLVTLQYLIQLAYKDKCRKVIAFSNFYNVT